MIDKNDKLHTVSAYLADRSNSGITYSLLLRTVQVKIGHVDFPLQMLTKVDKTAKDYWLFDYRNIMKQKNFVSYVSKLKHDDRSGYSYCTKTANDKFEDYMIKHKKLAKVKLSEISTEDAINIIDEHIVLIRQANADAQIKEKIKLVDEL
jgi:hypothetical protein